VNCEVIGATQDHVFDDERSPLRALKPLRSDLLVRKPRLRGAAESTSQPTFDASADASTDTGASATADASADTEEPPGRAKRLHNWTKRQYEQRMGLKKGFMNMKPGEGAGSLISKQVATTL
jgi:hypothetical protein